MQPVCRCAGAGAARAAGRAEPPEGRRSCQASGQNARSEKVGSPLGEEYESQRGEGGHGGAAVFELVDGGVQLIADAAGPYRTQQNRGSDVDLETKNGVG